jgi:hypothetical protein
MIARSDVARMIAPTTSRFFDSAIVSAMCRQSIRWVASNGRG